jgi:c-src tyrosine kinase
MGLYLVRESTNYPGDYTLCVSCDGKVEHYRIVYKEGKLSIDEEAFFENLMQLVEVGGGERQGWRGEIK